MNQPKTFFIVALTLLILTFINGSAMAKEKISVKGPDSTEVNDLADSIKHIIETKTFSKLNQFIKTGQTVDWGNCGPTDLEPFKLSSSKAIKRLYEYSRRIQIYINGDPEMMSVEDNSDTAVIVFDTEGWASEYPYLSFIFNYQNNHWEWRGVCYSLGPPISMAAEKEGRYEQVYKRVPTLPRPGPRIFKDPYNLRDRFKEIIKFNTLDALKPYAVKQEIILVECNREMAASGKITGTKVSSDQIINFLKTNIGASQEIKPGKGGGHDYLDTEGWQGTYPYIFFWFHESKKGWEWAGVAYCKSSLMHLLFPDEPRFK
ncbi:MAG: hypothetical protein AB1306_10700 [Nitrospirota bacterium]